MYKTQKKGNCFLESRTLLREPQPGQSQKGVGPPCEKRAPPPKNVAGRFFGEANNVAGWKGKRAKKLGLGSVRLIAEGI